MRKTFRLVLEGKASNGGFAIDQMTFNPGDCPSMFMMIYSWLIMILIVTMIFMMVLKIFVKEEVFCHFNDLVFPSDRPESATPKNVPRA